LPWPTIGICVSAADLLNDFFISSVPPVAALGDDATVAALSASVADGTDGAAVPSALAPIIDDTGGVTPFVEPRAVLDESEHAVNAAAEAAANNVKEVIIFFIAVSQYG
jgi:hypothetical protein